MPRREFSKAVKIEIVKRAMLGTGQVACEGCGLVLGSKPYHIDHVIPDALQIDKSKPLRAADGQLLGKDCCHDPKTQKQDVPAIAQAKRREAKNLGAVAPKAPIKSQGFRTSAHKAKRETRPKAQLPKRPLYQEVKA